MHLCRLFLTLAGALAAAACSTTTFRVVDAETHAPLQGITVERLTFHGLSSTGVDATTDVDGKVTFEGLSGFDFVTINPPDRPTTSPGGGSWSPHWSNGRRSVNVEKYWPDVWYRPAAMKPPEKLPLQKSVVKDGVAEIPIADEGRAIEARIDALLALPERDRAALDKLRSELGPLATVEGQQRVVVLQRMFVVLTKDVETILDYRGTLTELPPATNLLFQIGRTLSQRGEKKKVEQVYDNLLQKYGATMGMSLKERVTQERLFLARY